MVKDELIDALLKERQDEYKRRRHTGSKGSTWAVLYYIHHHGEQPVYPMDLCKELEVTTARITAILNELEEDGLIWRTTEEKDKRKICLTLTEKGEQMIHRHDDAHRAEAEKLIEAVGTEAVENYIRVSEIRRQILESHRKN